jgi:hypothetical protein
MTTYTFTTTATVTVTVTSNHEEDAAFEAAELLALARITSDDSAVTIEVPDTPNISLVDVSPEERD